MGTRASRYLASSGPPSNQSDTVNARASVSFFSSSDHTRSQRDKAPAARANFVYVDGRRFHGAENTPYMLPNDDEEADRLHEQHFALCALIGNNYVADQHGMRRVLDVGTGPGAWIMDMATEFPACEFIGVDVSPIQPVVVMPSNARFEITNILEGLCFADNAFDLVHARLLMAAMPKTCWPDLIADMARVCTSDGVVELCETDAIICNAGPVAEQVNGWLLAVCNMRVIDLSHVWGIPLMMQEAKLQVEKRVKYSMPIGEWCGPLGKVGLSGLVGIINGMRFSIMQACGVTDEHIDTLIAALPEEVNQRQSHWTIELTVGRKL
ncbi:S-adenosyl-L-methionine-dependent methyltransferase [Thamnocephalis sphaerospora]|uniref:S-adenosyl-L-methionine-dependent methyltransferase n=1 Tax=Thamnocephalis sphaerospora TaxID=78915 RepID=A0A4P9XSP7_9FUNG|nr:S-adenosyl-L-methionine-dependent methyltransferase [Thamnocephalis sphaerospora]|eukprot:RKP09147.1 S-adenosyl-L-methionine-dependent methyltransferase [Thamnocephalis sphaerospora]